MGIKYGTQELGKGKDEIKKEIDEAPF